jgi:hypothetical protein
MVTKPGPAKANLWKCKDLKALVKEQVRAHVKDVQLARKLEKALADEIAYGDGGGGGNVGVA